LRTGPVFRAARTAARHLSQALNSDHSTAMASWSSWVRAPRDSDLKIIPSSNVPGGMREAFLNRSCLGNRRMPSRSRFRAGFHSPRWMRAWAWREASSELVVASGQVRTVSARSLGRPCMSRQEA